MRTAALLVAPLAVFANGPSDPHPDVNSDEPAAGNPSPMTFKDMSDAWSEVTTTRGAVAQAHAAQEAAYVAWSKFAGSAHNAQGYLPVFAGAYTGFPGTAGTPAGGASGAETQDHISAAAQAHEAWSAAHSSAIIQQNGLMLAHLNKLKTNLIATHKLAEEVPLTGEQLHEQTLSELQAAAFSVQGCTSAVHAAAAAVSSAHIAFAAAGEKLRYATTNGGADQREIALAQADVQIDGLALDSMSKNYFVTVVGCRGAYEDYGRVAREFQEVDADLKEDQAHPTPAPTAAPATNGPADHHSGPADAAPATSLLEEETKAAPDAEDVETDTPVGPNDPHTPISEFINRLNQFGAQQLSTVAAVAANKAWAEFASAAAEAQQHAADTQQHADEHGAWSESAQHLASLHEAFLMAHASSVMQSNALHMGLIAEVKGHGEHEGTVARVVAMSKNQLNQQVEAALATAAGQLASCSSQVHAAAMGVAASHVQYASACAKVAYAHGKGPKVEGLAKIDADMAYLTFDNAQKGYFLAFVGCKGAYLEYQKVMKEAAEIAKELSEMSPEERDVVKRPAGGAVMETEEEAAEEEAEGESEEEEEEGHGGHGGGHHTHQEEEELALEADDDKMIKKEEAALNRRMRQRRHDGIDDPDAAYEAEVEPLVKADAAAHGHDLDKPAQPAQPAQQQQQQQQQAAPTAAPAAAAPKAPAAAPAAPKAPAAAPKAPAAAPKAPAPVPKAPAAPAPKSSSH